MKFFIKLSVILYAVFLFNQCKEEDAQFANIVLGYPSLRPLADVTVGMLGCEQSGLHPDSTCSNLTSLGLTVSDSEGKFVSTGNVYEVVLDKDGYLDIDYVNRQNPNQTVCYMGKSGWVRVNFEPLVPGNYFQTSVFLTQKIPIDTANKDSTELGYKQFGVSVYNLPGTVYGEYVADVPVAVTAYIQIGGMPTRDTTFYVPCFASDTNIVEFRY